MAVGQLATVEEFWKRPEPSDRRLELVVGHVVEKLPVGALAGLVAANLLSALSDVTEQHDVGLIFAGGPGYVLRRGPDQVRIPDVSFVVWDRVPDEGVPEGFWEGAPTLAVEVVSPHDRADDTHERVQDFLESGTQQVWVLWPRRQSVSVYSPNGDTRELGPDAQFDGGDVLPGFFVTVGDLFEVQRRR